MARLDCCTNETVPFRVAYLDHICVDENFRGKGIGKILMDKAEYEARLKGCSVSYIDTFTIISYIQYGLFFCNTFTVISYV